MSTTTLPKVRALFCDHRASEEEIYQTLLRATAPMTEAWQRIRKAKRIGIKFNQDMEPHNRVYHAGQLQQLVSEKVARAFLRLLKERTNAEIVCSDVSAYVLGGRARIEDTLTYAEIFRDYGVRFADGTKPPYKTVRVPGGGFMFEEYLLPEASVDVDEFISVAKLKNHMFMGVTLCVKNLFGLTPGEPEGHARTYFHHVVRMPYLLADLAKLYRSNPGSHYPGNNAQQAVHCDRLSELTLEGAKAARALASDHEKMAGAK